MSVYIDFAVYIDTPLDIAMARRLLRDYKDESIAGIHKELTNYLLRGRAAYLEMEKSVKPNSDVIIKGEQNTSLIVGEILDVLKTRLLN
jgi:uridine kinase